jgi:type II secretory pathway pseudopilin PulG
MFKSWTQTGMSLVEVMIGGAMLAGVALVGAELFKQQSSATQDVVARAELDAYHNKLTSILSDARNCNATFNSVSLSSSNTGNFSLSICCPNESTNPSCSLTQSSCLPPFPPYIPITDRKLILYPNPWGTTPPPGTKGGFTARFLPLFNSSETGPVVAPAGGGVVKTILQIEYRLLRPYLSSGSSGAGRVIRKIPLNFKFSALGAFLGCVDGESGSKNTLQQELCRTLGPRLTYYSSGTDECKYLNTTPTHSCPGITGDPRSILIGLNSNGDPVCRSGIDAFNESDIIDPAAASDCGPGKNVGFYYDSVSKTIRVQCL